MRHVLLILPFVATSLLANTTPYSVATLVQATEDAVLTEQITDALHSPTALVRATAARVIAVNGLTQFLSLLRQSLTDEPDATAAREEIRALALIGNDDDVAVATKASSRWPEGMDNALALAVARRGGIGAVQLYSSQLRKTRMTNTTDFFRMALWGRLDAVAITGSRILADSDEGGWRAILRVLYDSKLAMNGGPMSASLTSSSEDIRSASMWFLVRGYASDPASMNDIVKNKLRELAEERAELSSDREDFGLELLRRMLGGEKRENPRWLKFLESSEADDLLRGETSALLYLTDAEYLAHYNRCEVQSTECAIPAKRSQLTIPSQLVTPPAFNLPEVLPAGLTDAIMLGAQCRDTWLGVTSATVDSAGRIRSLDLAPIATTKSCRTALNILLRLSMATNTSLASALSGPILLVHSARDPLCLDEEAPKAPVISPVRAGGAVQAPKVLRRVEPQFPESARRAMGSGRNVLIIVEAVVTKSGCVRSLRVLKQSPFGELNGAALMAISRWSFLPGTLDGKPVDVLFNLTINFLTR